MLAIFLGALLQAACVAEDEKQSARKPFTVVRDPKLGKPLLSLWTPPKDAAGRQAVDVIEQFLIYVRDDDIDSAKKLCEFEVWAKTSDGSIGRVTANELPSDPEYAKQALAEIAASEALFPKFVQELQQATKYTLGATVKQKSKFWNMRVAAEGVKKQPWPYRVDFSYEHGSWRIQIYDLTARYDPKRSIPP